jgi:hypothetical protein
MSLMHKVRFYHAALAIFTVLAFLSGDFGIVQGKLFSSPPTDVRLSRIDPGQHPYNLY